MLTNFQIDIAQERRFRYLDEPEVMWPLDREKELAGETLFGWLTVLLGRIDALERKAMPAAVQPFDQARYDQMIAHVRTRIASSQG